MNPCKFGYKGCLDCPEPKKAKSSTYKELAAECPTYKPGKRGNCVCVPCNQRRVDAKAKYQREYRRHSHISNVAARAKEFAALRKDRRILDWLDDQRPLMEYNVIDEEWRIYAADASGMGETFREAATAAMRQSRGAK